jgi:hypothetical protein
MYPPLQVSVGRLSYNRAYQLLIPFLPGGTLVLLLMLRRPYLISHGSAELGLGHFGLAAALIFGAYVAGFILQFLSTGVQAAISFAFWSQRRRKYHHRDYPELAKSRVWRSIATQFLGEKLTPPTPHTDEERNNTEDDWREWYNVLQDYLRDEPVLLIPHSTLQSIVGAQATGWAIIIAEFAFPTYRHWELLAIALLSILLALAVPPYQTWLYTITPQISTWKYSARLLREIKPIAKPGLMHTGKAGNDPTASE